MPAPGRFPLLTRDAVAATVVPGSGRLPTHLDRKAAAVATATVTDGFRRAFQQGTDGVGLRGGTFATSFTGNAVALSFSNARLATDLAVTGDASLSFGDTTVTPSGAAAGTLHITGVWSGPGATALNIDGHLGGRPVHVTVPAT